MPLDLLVTQNSTDKDIVSQCCICRDFELKDHTYKKFSEEDTLTIKQEFLVSHGYCGSCFDAYMEENK
jgi:hypothetical protein